MCIKSLQYFQAHPKCHVPANKVNKYTFTYLVNKYLFIIFSMAGPTWGAQHSENSTFRKLRSWQLITSLHGKWMGKEWQTSFFGGASKITADGNCSHEIKDAWFLEESYDQSRQCIKKQRHYFPNKGPSSQSYGFSTSYVWMWELDCKESWAPKNWCFWTVVLERTLESPLDCKEIQPVHPKGNQSWICSPE